MIKLCILKTCKEVISREVPRLDEREETDWYPASGVLFFHLMVVYKGVASV